MSLASAVPERGTAVPTLAVLAGGAGRRMGTPKSQLMLNGVPILQGLMARMRWAGPTLLVTAPGRTRPPGAGAFDREVADDVADEGPLRGVFTALTAAATEIVVCLTVDMPAVEAFHARWIADALRERPDELGMMCLRYHEGQEAVEPFPSAFRRSASPIVGAALAGRRRSVQGLLREAGFAAVDVPADWPERTWTNLNHPADIDAFLGEGA